MKINKFIKEFYVWDGINGHLEGFETEKECEEFIKEIFIDELEGIHPDIESVFILKPHKEIAVFENEQGDYTVSFNQSQKP